MKPVLMALLGLISISPLFAAPDSLLKVTTKDQFLELARTTEGDSYAKFLIDRSQNTIHYLDTRKYPFHYLFAKTLYPNLSEQIFGDQTYYATNRRFVAGTLGYHSGLDRYTFQFWEGDPIGDSVFQLTVAKLKETFHTTALSFKPNSPIQEEFAKTVKDIPILTNDELYAALAFKVYNPGTAVGRLRVIKPEENVEQAEFDFGDIVLLSVIPSDITPVAGIISTQFSTPLSHMNLRAYAWKIPNMVLRSATKELGSLDGQVVHYTCSPEGYAVRAATAEEAEEFENRQHKVPTIRLQADVTYRELPDLSKLTKADADRVGSKSANLAELDRVPQLNVPRGFAIPFAFYEDFIRANGIDKVIDSTMSDRRLQSDAQYRRQKLDDLRRMIQAGKHTEVFEKALLEKIHARFEGKGVFVRSSTNSEDLPGFNGAGLYESVPNVQGDAKILDAVKVVWASIFSNKAYRERQFHGIDHVTVKAAILVVETLNAKSAGVMITTDIYDGNFPDSFTINASHGLGIKVVDGKSLPEQVIYDPYFDSIKVITRSEEATELIILSDGGVVEKPIEAGRPILSEADVRALGAAGQLVRDTFFREGPQDIEWVVTGTGSSRKAWVVQSRPYLGGGTATAPVPAPTARRGFQGAAPRREAAYSGPFRVGPAPVAR